MKVFSQVSNLGRPDWLLFNNYLIPYNWDPLKAAEP